VGPNVSVLTTEISTHRSGNRQLDPGAKIPGSCVFEMKDTPRLTSRGFRRRMYGERAHGDDAARGGDAIHDCSLVGEYVDLRVREHTKTVRVGKHSQRAVRRRRVVENRIKSRPIRAVVWGSSV
jgi:hypothetical protein